MAWFNLPINTATNIHDHRFVNQFHKALQERAWAAGTCIFPEPSWQWYSGTVTGITATTLTDANARPDEDGVGQGWCVADQPNPGDSWKNPWACANPPDPFVDPWDYVPTTWTVVIDDTPPEDGLRPDPMRVVKADITSWTATTLTIDDISDYVTSGYVTSLASLVGKRYYIIRQNGGYFWHERVLETPNDYEWSKGTVVAATATTVQVTVRDGRGIDVPASFGSGEHVGRDLLVRDTTGKLQRVTITASEGDVLEFATQSWTAGLTPFVVLDAGAKGYPGKASVYPFTAHRGANEGDDGFGDGYSGHMPASHGDPMTPALGDYVTGIHVPAVTYCVNDAGLIDCSVTCREVYDFDWHTDPMPTPDQMLCGYPEDKIVSPDFWKTFRAIQAGIEQLAPFYVDPVSYDGEKEIPNFTVATFFHSAGINATTSTVTAVDGDGSGFDFSSITLPYTPIETYFTIVDDDGEVMASGSAALSTNHIEGTAGDYQSEWVGYTVYFSFGWTRFFPREVQRMFYGKTCFKPDETADDFGQIVPVDPPTTENFDEDGCQVGTWVHRPKSTKYAEPAKQGKVEVDDFVVGEYARYVGDNWGDPILPGTPAELVDYDDLFFTGTHPTAVERLRDQQRAGTVTASRTPAASNYLTDESQNWWYNWWHPSQLDMHVEQGTAGTGSSTTAMHDASKAPTTPESAPNCWWKSSRFPDGPYVGFTIEFLMSGSSWDDSEAVIEKRLITGGSDTTVSVSWSGALSATCLGKQYRIREPESYELNRFKDRQLTITDLTGTKHTTTIIGNDDETLFFDDVGFAVTEGMKYQIDEVKTGGVYEWTGTEWTPVEGADAARIGAPVPSDFVDFLPGNLPTYVRRYGKMLRGDSVDANEFWDELYRGFNKLIHVKHDANWDNKSGPEATPVGTEVAHDEPGAQQFSHGGSFSEPCDDPDSHWYESWQDVVDDAMWYWDQAAASPVMSSGRPYLRITVSGNSGNCYTYKQGRRFAWAFTTIPCTHQYAAVDFYAYSQFNVIDDPLYGPYFPEGEHNKSDCGIEVINEDPAVIIAGKVQFDADGANLAYRAWSCWNTTVQTESVVYSSDSLGSLDQPSPKAYPGAEFHPPCNPGETAEEDWCSARYGFEVVDECAIARYNRSGGFDYYA